MAWKATLSALAGHVNVSLLSEDGRVEVGGSFRFADKLRRILGSERLGFAKERFGDVRYRV